jgi:hypothetical protein
MAECTRTRRVAPRFKLQAPQSLYRLESALARKNFGRRGPSCLGPFQNCKLNRNAFLSRLSTEAMSVLRP